MQVGNTLWRGALIIALLAPGPAFAARNSGFMPQFEFQTLIAPMSYSEIKNGSNESGFSGTGFHLRAGLDFGIFGVLGYAAIHEQKNTSTSYGIVQTKKDWEAGGLLRIDTAKAFGMFVGAGQLVSKIETADREHPSTTMSGMRVFFGLDYMPCLNEYVCGIVEFTATAMGEYTKSKGREIPKRKVQTTGYEAALGIAVKY